MKAPLSKQNIVETLARVSIRLRTFLGWTGNPEQEQAAIRVVMLTAILAYLLLTKPDQADNHELWSSGTTTVYVLLVSAFSIYQSTIFWPSPSHLRKIFAILADMIGISYTLHITGPIGTPWYGLYLWVILGNGFRYGERYLYLATTIAFLGFILVVTSTEYWTDNSGIAFGLSFTLLLIPAYSAVLIRRLNEARMRADAASRAKSDFLSCMSHEIRTPLNGILGMTDLLRLRPLSPEDKDCVETIHLSGHALARQINDILDLAKIESGKITLETVDFDLHVLINNTLRIFVPQTQEKNLLLDSYIDPATPFLLSGDPHKVRQIITNLIGNAIKFTQRGKITLRISPVSTHNNMTVIRFEVADTGTGIPDNKLQLIFDPFTQASESVSRNYGGTGLGTTICRNLVHLMEGTIGVESILNVGTSFWFEIPFSTKETWHPAKHAPWTADCRVLYLSPGIHDNDTILQLLRNWKIHYDAYTSVDEIPPYEESSVNYHVLLLNDMFTSSTFSDSFTNIDKTLSVNFPKILLTSSEYSYIRKLGRPPNYIFHPPINDALILNAIHAHYSKHAENEEVVTTNTHDGDKYRFCRQLNVLVCDDNAINRLVMQRMLDKLGHRYTTVDGGEAALLALESEPFDAVIIDKNMPDMGGVEVYKAFSLAHGGTAPVEFAILTADATEDAKVTCSNAGITHFLTKPVSLSKLAQALSEMCNAQPDSQVASPSVADNEATEAKLVGIFNETEFDKLAEIGGNEFAFLDEVVNNFIHDTNSNLKGLETSAAKGDLHRFRDLAHALKGSAYYLGLTQVAELAKKAQNISEPDFRNKGINEVIALRRATDSAFAILEQKLRSYSQNRVASQLH